MDLNSLALILQSALSPNPNERKAAEQSLNQVNLSLNYVYIQFTSLVVPFSASY